MSLKLAENSFLHSMIVGLCDTQISRFSPILTNNTHREIKKKLVKKSADFYGQEKSAYFLSVGKSFGGTQALVRQAWGVLSLSMFKLPIFKHQK